MLSIPNDKARRHTRALDKINFTASVKSDHTEIPGSEIPKWHHDAMSSNATWSLPSSRRAPSPAQHSTALKSTSLHVRQPWQWLGFQEGSSIAMASSHRGSTAGIPLSLLPGACASLGHRQLPALGSGEQMPSCASSSCLGKHVLTGERTPQQLHHYMHLNIRRQGWRHCSL